MVVKYIVYLSSGEYSGYSINGVLIGDIDPIPVLDQLAMKRSDGVFRSWESIKNDDWKMGPHETATYFEILKKMAAIRQDAPQALKDAGFVEAEAIEVWTGG